MLDSTVELLVGLCLIALPLDHFPYRWFDCCCSTSVSPGTAAVK
jgi:hypothetical protein